MSGYIEKRGENAYRLVVDLPRDVTGKRERKTRTYHGTKREARKALAQFTVELAQRPSTIGGEILVRDFVEREFLPMARKTIGSTTYQRYERVLDNDVLPALGHLRLEDVKRQHVQTMVDSLQTRRRLDTREGRLSPRTVLHIHRVAHRVFVYAIRTGRLDRNPSQYIDLPRLDTAEPVVPDVDDIPVLLEVFAGTRLYMPVLLAVTTGMRRGEILGLQWRDVDLEGRTLTVARSLGVSTADGVFLKEPKTKRSRRTLLLAAVTVEALKEAKEAVGGDPKPDDFVVRGFSGGYWGPSQFSSEFCRTAKDKGLPYRFHDLRHAHASQLLALGTPIPVVSARLGHCDAATTLRVYAHVLPGQDGAAVEALDGALAGAGVG